MQIEVNDIFEIKIDFEAGLGSPGRVFKSMSKLIDAMQSLDGHLLGAYDNSLDVSLLLEEVQSGSIKSILRNVVQGAPDEALKSGDWKQVLGHYLVQAKYKILEWLRDRKEISHRKDIRPLEEEIQKLAEETDLKHLPAYTVPSAEVLLSDINKIQGSLTDLEENDVVTYRYSGGEIRLNRELNISNEIIRKVLTKEIIESFGIRIVKVKKPDYLGHSMWTFQYDGRLIEAKILDENWLVNFQNRIVEVRPGDSLRVKLFEEIFYGFEGEIVQRHYEIQEVHEIIVPPKQDKLDF